MEQTRTPLKEPLKEPLTMYQLVTLDDLHEFAAEQGVEARAAKDTATLALILGITNLVAILLGYLLVAVTR